ncbi:hypothetical protein SAMN05216378_2774 [Paenibacillus catalpae]|uniref:Uncharacterized protein n=1 Tax=Paenibacillus catalpae TaxID=1045775 RepID=A0A1I1YR64_9BACL|nr:hypothetical protein [Paenibacillus catalpae]SFE22074.1 hypothetical protein SAMN05216378_2774 [Paenibacillus catalpae]
MSILADRYEDDVYLQAIVFYSSIRHNSSQRWLLFLLKGMPSGTYLQAGEIPVMEGISL